MEDVDVGDDGGNAGVGKAMAGLVFRPKFKRKKEWICPEYMLESGDS